MHEGFPSNNNEEIVDNEQAKIPAPTEEEMDRIRREAGVEEHVGEREMGHGPDEFEKPDPVEE